MKIVSVVPILCWLGCSASSVMGADVGVRGAVTRLLSDDEEYDLCFKEMHKTSLWPLETSQDISLAFGPYNSYCDHTDKFHRGITIRGNEGENVRAIQPGVVVDVFGESDKKTVVIQHTLDEDCTFHDETSPYWYSTYGHLGTVFVSEGENVCGYAGSGPSSLTSCQTNPSIIGQLGRNYCGSDNTALHASLSHEVRLGGRYSSAYCKEHDELTFEEGCFPDSEPQVNPLYPQLEKQSPNFSFTVPSADDIDYGTTDVKVDITQDAPYTLNRIRVECDESSSDGQEKSFRIDFNKRTSFYPDAATLMNKAHPYIDATHTKVSLDEAMYMARVVIPAGWYADGYSGGKNECTISAHDIWDNYDYETFLLRDKQDDWSPSL